MNIEPTILAIVITMPVIAILTYAIYHFGYFIYHWHKVVSNVTNKYGMFMGPFLLLRSSNFNEIGQASLTESMRHFRRFLFSILPVALLAVVGVIVKANAA